jgi:hypothetical protein
LELESSATPLPPEEAFVVDSLGNAKGGVRTPYVDVPTARWIGAKSGPFICLFHGYKLPFDAERLRSLYPNHAGYFSSIKASVNALVAQRWLTARDGKKIIQEAQGAAIPPSR